jgi:chorismate mutase
MSLDLVQIREDLDSLNKEIVDAVEKRMNLVADVAEYKDEKDMQIKDEEREEEVKQEFERLYQERDLPEGRGRELATLLIETAIDKEEEMLDREID